MKKNLLLIFAEKLFTQKSIDLIRLDEQLQIAFQILINKGYKVLASGEGEQSFEFAKKFAYVFQDENMKNVENKLTDSQKFELMENSDCIICFQEELVQLDTLLNINFIFIDIEEKNVDEKGNIEENFVRLSIDSLNAGKIIDKVQQLTSCNLGAEKENYIDIKSEKSSCIENESVEFEENKKQIINTIEQFINDNELEKAKNLIKEYEFIVDNDINVCSMKAVIAIMENKLSEAEEILKYGLGFDKNNFDLIYNLAYVYKLKQNYVQSKQYYLKAKQLNKNVSLLLEIENSLIEIDKFMMVQ